MPGSRRPTLSRTGLAYGEEYPLDDVDTYVNGILLERYAERTSSLPRVALNLGCRTGLRAFSLAQLEVLGRPLFDEIIAQDLIDYGTDIAVRNTGKVPIRFRQQDVAALDAAAFEGIEVVYVDFRRVGHFLSPFHFRKALRTIGNIVADDGLVTVTFDGIRPRLGFLPLTKSATADFYARHRVTDDRLNRAAYSRYSYWSVRNYMTGLGFRPMNHRIESLPYESNIVAFAPARSGRQAPRSSGPTARRQDL